MRILLLDNYDSFTYNLLHYLELLDADVTVRRNDEIPAQFAVDFDAVVLSPGPGLPSDAGCMPDMIREFCDKKPILGICLGMQALVEHFGGSLLNLEELIHGRSSPIHVVAEDPLFSHLSSPFVAGRYHSWVADPATIPESLLITAKDPDGNIMAISHRSLPLHGVQFHPESILTPEGFAMMRNWMQTLKN